MARAYGPWLTACLLATLASPASALDIRLAGTIGGSRAIVVIDDGRPVTLSTGQGHDGIRLLAVQGNTATFEIGGDKVKQVIKVRNGIDSELAKKLQRLLKDSKIKVQAAIQEEKVRVSGTKRDDLQAAMALIRKDISEMPLSFNNFRD